MDHSRGSSIPNTLVLSSTSTQSISDTGTSPQINVTMEGESQPEKHQKVFKQWNLEQLNDFVDAVEKHGAKRWKTIWDGDKNLKWHWTCLSMASRKRYPAIPDAIWNKIDQIKAKNKPVLKLKSASVKSQRKRLRSEPQEVLDSEEVDLAPCLLRLGNEVQRFDKMLENHSAYDQCQTNLVQARNSPFGVILHHESIKKPQHEINKLCRDQLVSSEALISIDGDGPEAIDAMKQSYFEKKESCTFPNNGALVPREVSQLTVGDAAGLVTFQISRVQQLGYPNLINPQFVTLTWTNSIQSTFQLQYQNPTQKRAKRGKSEARRHIRNRGKAILDLQICRITSLEAWKSALVDGYQTAFLVHVVNKERLYGELSVALRGHGLDAPTNPLDVDEAMDAFKKLVGKPIMICGSRAGRANLQHCLHLHPDTDGPHIHANAPVLLVYKDAKDAANASYFAIGVTLGQAWLNQNDLGERCLPFLKSSNSCCDELVAPVLVLGVHKARITDYELNGAHEDLMRWPQYQQHTASMGLPLDNKSHRFKSRSTDLRSKLHCNAITQEFVSCVFQTMTNVHRQREHGLLETTLMVENNVGDVLDLRCAILLQDLLQKAGCTALWRCFETQGQEHATSSNKTKFEVSQNDNDFRTFLANNLMHL